MWADAQHQLSHGLRNSSGPHTCRDKTKPVADHAEGWERGIPPLHQQQGLGKPAWGLGTPTEAQGSGSVLGWMDFLLPFPTAHQQLAQAWGKSSHTRN